MNVFRILGDLSHLLAMFLLLGKIWRSKSCAGISGKSQILFALVFTTRYLDLVSNFISIYNTVMKVVFLLCAYTTVYMIYWKFRKTFDSENDTFRLEFLLVPVIGLSFLVNYSYAPTEVLWTFSIYLESVAILPQLFMISKTGEAETITTHYLFFLGLYRALYLANWIWRYQTENFYDQISVVSGVVQTIFYCDFFYLYVTKGRHCPKSLDTLWYSSWSEAGSRLIPSAAYLDGGGTNQWESYLCTDKRTGRGLLTDLVGKII
ncbi:ER lumen protein-retaining receptor 3 [Peromyscus eremicus]|uniref:ER lumen protein-retaining receptor 3 n=1 Tax=Peromyscus eremicus TaxID=42410 RepID=UPI0027DB2A5E|nr:ER lumen protein-retaining receptor 3 [Peromyscus eremicus]